MANAGDSITVANAGWTFSGNVAETFDPHVQKSVPLYHEGHDLIVRVSDFFLSDGSCCYELGSSTGTLTRRLADHNKSKKVRYVGLDVEPEMVNKARKNHAGNDDIAFEVADILDAELEPCDMVVAYYTMQFVKPKLRQMVFDKIYKSLNWGGAFLLFEKVRGPDARFQDIAVALYTDYKLHQGYDEIEIVSKSRSLKGILEPFSTQGNIDLMKRAGFQDIMTIMKYVCFEGFLAIK